MAAIAPFDPTVIPAEATRRLEAALAVCGGPRRGYSFEPDTGAAPPPDRFALCKPSTHAKLLARFASFEASNPLPLPPRQTGVAASSRPDPPSRWKDAVAGFRLALALDSGTRAPNDANDRAQEAFASAKRRVRGVTRLEGPTSPPDKALEEAIRAALPSFAFCYLAGLINNPNLQGVITIDAAVDPDGWLTNVRWAATMPDSGVVGCVTRSADGLILPALSNAPKTIRLKLHMSPDPESLEKETARRRAGLPP